MRILTMEIRESKLSTRASTHKNKSCDKYVGASAGKVNNCEMAGRTGSPPNYPC